MLYIIMKNNMKRLNECSCNSEMDYSNSSNYMFFENLKTLKKSVDAIVYDPLTKQEFLIKAKSNE